jgi:hypothetical protein
MAADTWKQDERDIAAEFTRVLQTVDRFDHVCTRVPLSGSNNRRTDGTPHHGDVSFPDELDIHAELKRRKSYVHQSTMDAAKADAKKHGFNPDNVILITKTLRQRGFTAVIDASLFFKLLELPGAIEIFKRGDSDHSTRRNPAPRFRRTSTKEAHKADGSRDKVERQEAGSSETQDDHQVQRGDSSESQSGAGGNPRKRRASTKLSRHLGTG